MPSTPSSRRNHHQLTKLTAGLLIAGALGLTYQHFHSSSPPQKPSEKKQHIVKKTHLTHKNLPHRGTPRKPHSPQQAPLPDFALANERVLIFDSPDAYQRFLTSSNARSLTVLGRSDSLRAVRIRLNNNSHLGEIEGATIGYNYQAHIPTPPQASAQAGATGFGGDLLPWLGITEDNTSWGKGVTVAVIDSGVNKHIALQGDITRLNLTSLPPGTQQLGHGTAVASIISGDHPLTPGIAPASDILSIRVTDEAGLSNSFLLAEGITRAVDEGAEVINVSMGSYGDSQVLANAVRYAQNHGAVIVASPGNEGLTTLAKPAGYPGVISAGAVEQKGDHLDFSNSGNNLSIAAPGYKINAAWGNDLLTAFTGTSASAPVVSGAIAATLSENPELTPRQAADRVIALSNDAGLPGPDPDYGNGILDLGRVMEAKTPHIFDAAIASQILLPPSSPNALPELWVTVQNQGTAPLINTPVTISTPSGTQHFNISSLTPGQIQTLKLPIRVPANGTPITVTSKIKPPAADNDSHNNSRTTQFQK